MKKWTLMVLVGVLAAGVLAGCSGGGEEAVDESTAKPAGPAKPVREGQQAQQAKPEEPL